MKFFPRKAVVASAVTLGALATVPAMAQSASASPTQCSASFTAGTASSFCASGTGEHRIVCFYTHHIPGVGTIESYGPWQPAGSTSSTYCPADRVTNSFVEVR